MKQNVNDRVSNSKKPKNLDELEERITNFLTNIPENMLRSAVVNVPAWQRKCADGAGAYLEVVHKNSLNTFIFSLLH